jgi:sec-independent protein translocase protein TatB
MLVIMFDIGFGEMVLIAAIALIAIGPKQLPEVARTVGKLLGELKKAVGDVTSTVANARDETDKAIRKVTSDLTDVTDGINRDVANKLNMNPKADADAAVSPNSVPAPAIEPQVNAVPQKSYEPNPIVSMPEHPGDPPWVVNPDLPNPNEVAAQPLIQEQLPLTATAPSKSGNGDKS